MFKTDGTAITEYLSSAVQNAERNYIIKKNDLLNVLVYTNKGEKLIDPNSQLQQMGEVKQISETDLPSYLVQSNGLVRLPMVDLVKLEGFTLYQADSVLQVAYGLYYKEVFVHTNYINKRVILLGAINAGMGGNQGGNQGGGQGGGLGVAGVVFPLENEETNLIEVLASIGGLRIDSRVENIRLIRGNLNNPEVYLIDLSTIEGMKKANLILQPNDIIYVETIRRPLVESMRD